MTIQAHDAHTAGSTEPPAGPRPRRPRSLRVAAVVASVVGVVVLASVALHNNSARVGPTLAGPTQSPGAGASASGPLSVRTISGSTFNLPAGKPAVLFFMTGECASCIEGARTLDGIERQYGDGLAVLAVDMDPGATTAAVRAFAQAAGNPRFDFARDPDGRMVSAFAVRALDTVVVTDANGVEVYRGPSTDQASLRSAVAKAATL